MIGLWRAGQLRFRLETYGVYYPALPYQSSWWRPSPLGLKLLAQQLASYARWVEEMHTVRTHGAEAWWQRYRSDTE